MNEKRDGVDVLRRAVETVAGDIESRGSRSPNRRRLAALAGVAAMVVIALLSGWRAYQSSRNPEVDVLVMKVSGRPVDARVVEAAPGTILIVPRREEPPAAVTATLAMRGAK